MLITQKNINSLSRKEWEGETQKELDEFEGINREIEEVYKKNNGLYPKESHGEKGNLGETMVSHHIAHAKKIAWIFRKQSESDYGIDAQFEIKEGGVVTGRLIAAQIKCGGSHVKEKNDHFVYYGEFKHLLYWLEYSLPVVVVFVDDKDPDLISTCYWVEIKKEKIKTLKSSWKIRIPKSQTLDKKCKNKLAKVSPKKPINDLRFTELQLQRPLMEHLYDGGKIAIENKGVEGPRIIIENQDGSVVDNLCWKDMFSTALFHKECPDYPFPWADLDIGEECDLTSEEVEVTPEEMNAILDAEHDSEGSKSGGESKFYIKLNSFGIEFLNISIYLALGIDGLKIADLRKSINTAINFMNSSELSDKEIADRVRMPIERILMIRKIKEENVNVEKVAKVFGLDVEEVPLLHISFDNE
ncbi:DUF4365 domain-containing protein [Bacillus mycoides]|uniref:DUF4365 domain-containing protein n=1 Tax=Bacillus mycoides TaxID=1405 RepID=UPI001C02A6CD|nr:DUF4365 domain-containing protein [Bacillus mycoides]QWG44703.1 DUF4365 domain-containing protein [Bacillus mycoides]